MFLYAVKYVHLCMTAYRDWWRRTAGKENLVLLYCWVLLHVALALWVIFHKILHYEAFHSCQHLSAIFPCVMPCVDYLIGLLYDCEMKCDTANPKSFE